MKARRSGLARVARSPLTGALTGALTCALTCALAGAWAPAQAQDIADLFRSALACTLIEPTLADTRAAPLYRDAGPGCAAGLPNEKTARDAWYLDAACSLPVAVEHTPLTTWCDSLLEPGTLGEGQGIGQGIGQGPGEPAGRSSWTLSPGSRLALGARSLDGVVQPWQSSEVFRRIRTPVGTCELQMRIHAPAPVVRGRVADRFSGPDGRATPAANGLAMIAWHGGSWSNRAFGSAGLELSVPHFVARGFTVYAPFYRLLGDSPDGSAACRQADFERDVVSDAQAAFDWVRDNGERFGTSGAPILFGQSAGGQLAARLAIDRADEVAGAVLFYAPVDFDDFATRARSGAYTDEQGLDILERVLGVPAARADVSASPIAPNALPRRVVRDGIEAPPMFLLHGEADSLVEVRQSMRLCNALAGRQLDAPGSTTSIDPLRLVVPCGGSSSLHRIRQGRHALDVCALAGPVPLDSCPAGSRASRERVADSIGSAAVFAESVSRAAARQAAGEVPDNPLQQGEPPIDPPAPDDAMQGTGGQGGGGAPGPLLLALSVVALIWRSALAIGASVRAGPPAGPPAGPRQCPGRRLRRASFAPAGIR